MELVPLSPADVTASATRDLLVYPRLSGAWRLTESSIPGDRRGCQTSLVFPFIPPYVQACLEQARASLPTQISFGLIRVKLPLRALSP